MISRASRSILALALCCSFGGHWIALQSIAWTTMLVDYSQKCSFKQAIVQTFDGAHPCDLCKQVSKNKTSEKSRDSTRLATKADLICVTRRFATLPPFKRIKYLEHAELSAAISQEPASPPPRSRALFS